MPALPQKKSEIYRSQNACYSLGGAIAIFSDVIFKKKVSCFTFSFAYEKIRKSMKKGGPGGSRGVLGVPQGVRERFGEAW